MGRKKKAKVNSGRKSNEDSEQSDDYLMIDSLEQVTDDVKRKTFQLSGPCHQHKSAKNCGSPNCLTGLGEGQGPVWDELAREKALRELSGESDNPCECVRDASEGWSPTGLRNLGATCYMNSLLQVLFTTTPFRSGLYKFRPPQKLPKGESQEALAQKMSVMIEFQKTMARMQAGNAKWIRPDAIPKLLEVPTNEQQDVEEFFMLLLAQYCDYCFRLCDDTKTLFTDLFGGQHAFETTCLECGSVSQKREPCYVIQLPLTDSVMESFVKYVEPEELGDDNLLRCEVCNKLCKAKRAHRLASPTPPVLVLQITRFQYDLKQQSRIKKLTKVSAPRVLNVAAFAEEQEDKNSEYELYAIICHVGTSAHGGHYVAHLKQDDGSWVEMDDETVRPLKPEEAGLTVSMREGTKKADKDDPEYVDSGNGNGGRRRGKKGKGGNNSSNGAANGQGKPDLTQVTVGSAAPYLLFYRERSSSWDKLSCELPVYLTQSVQKENDLLTQRAASYEVVSKNFTDQMERLRSLHDCLADGVSPAYKGKYYWISSAWLENWVTHPELQPEAIPIDNQSIMCIHSRVSPQKVGQMKRVTEEAWIKLRDVFGGGPELSQESECDHCVLEFCREELARKRRDGAIKNIKNLLKSQPPERNKHFLMSSAWLTQWKASPDEVTKENVNSDLACEHGNLTADADLFVRVEPQVWEFFSEECPGIKAWPHNSGQCAECLDALEMERNMEDQRKQERAALRKKFSVLCDRKKPTVLSKLEVGVNYLVSADWVGQLRKFLLDGQDGELSPVDNSRLLCQHGQISVSLDSELNPGPSAPIKPVRPFFVICKREWDDLTKLFGSTGPELVLDVSEAALGRNYKSQTSVCMDCVREREQQEAQLNLDFVEKEVTIQVRSLPTSTRSGRYKTRGTVGTTKTTMKVTTNAADTVGELKLAIFAAHDIEPFRMSLQFQGVDLVDDFPLSSFGVFAGCTIDMFLRNPSDGDGPVVDLVEEVASASAKASRRPEVGFKGSILMSDLAFSSSSQDDGSDEGSEVGHRCSACTYINLDRNATKCAMCETPFAVKHPKKRTKSSDDVQ